MEVNFRLFFVAPLRPSMALAWSVCHGLCPLFFPLEEISVVRKYGVFNAAKAHLIRSIVLRLGRSQTPR